MSVNIMNGFETLDQIMNCCINMELTENSLLEDVESFVNTYYDEGSVEEPVIWMTQHPTTADRQADISHTMDLITPFQFDCGVYEVDISDANLSSQNLCCRVILAILKNWRTAQSEVLKGQRMIKNISLETYSPMGYVPVEGKSDKVAITSVVLNVNHIINWQLCCQQLNNSNGEGNNG